MIIAMPYDLIAGPVYLRLNGNQIELIVNDDVVVSMTAEQARSNAADLIHAANRLERDGCWLTLGEDGSPQ